MVLKKINLINISNNRSQAPSVSLIETPFLNSQATISAQLNPDNNSIDFFYDGDLEIPLSGLTINFMFETPTSLTEISSLTSTDNFILLGLPKKPSAWVTPINSLQCTQSICHADLALLNLSPDGGVLTQSPLATLGLPAQVFNNIQNLSFNLENTIVISKSGEKIKLDTMILVE